MLKTEAPADEMLGKNHKPEPDMEPPRRHKPRSIDEQQDTGSKLQADYATHREETPLTFENTAPVPTTSVENTETTIPEKPMPLDDRSESAEQSESEPEYSSELYEDWRSDAGNDDAPIADKTTNFDFRAGVVADKNGKSHKSRKYKFGKKPKQPKAPQDDEDEDDAEEETVNEDSPDVQETNDSDE